MLKFHFKGRSMVVSLPWSDDLHYFEISWAKSPNSFPLYLPVAEMPKSPFGDFPETLTARHVSSCAWSRCFPDFVSWGFLSHESFSLNSQYLKPRWLLDLCHASSQRWTVLIFSRLWQVLPFAYTRVKPRTPSSGSDGYRLPALDLMTQMCSSAFSPPTA